MSFRFQHTDAWEEARRHAAERPLDTGAGADTFPPDALLDELRHDGDLYRAERERALSGPSPWRWRGSTGSPFRPRRSRRRSTIPAGPRSPRAGNPGGWLGEQGLTPESLFRLVREGTLESRIRTLAAADLGRPLLERLAVAHDVLDRALLAGVLAGQDERPSSPFRMSGTRIEPGGSMLAAHSTSGASETIFM